MYTPSPRIQYLLGTQNTPKVARQIVAIGKAASRSESTIETYELELRRLTAKDGNVWLAAQNTSSPKTWYLRRAAILYDIEEKLMDCLWRLEALRLSASASVGIIKILKIKQHAQLLEQINELEELYNAAPNGLPLVTTKPRQSKRRLGRGLPNDWREQLASRLKNWQTQFLVAAITGCRPAELLKGVTLKVDADYLVAEIVGAKLTAHSG